MRLTLAGLFIGTALLVGCDDKSSGDKTQGPPGATPGPMNESGNNMTKPPTTSPNRGSGGGSAPTGGGVTGNP